MERSIQADLLIIQRRAVPRRNSLNYQAGNRTARPRNVRARVSRMRRGIGLLVLVAVIVGAAWCADGCPDPTDQTLPHSSSVSACICVIPFATVARFSLPERELPRQAYAEVTVVHLWLAPVLSIDHPPRFR